MTDQYKIKDILEAVDNILKKNNNDEEPLKLINEIKENSEKFNQIPKDTENIIKQAEKYLKRN
tara:strand:- start:332 stop:520 length:189 start_codon:yes stop_codon:yes gene_type:complete